MPTHAIVIPDWHPTRLNLLLSAHWTRARRMKKADAGVVKAYALACGVPKATGPRRVSLRVEGWGRGGPTVDPDALWKVVLDALVAAGLLVDDDPARCTLGTVEIVRGKKRETVITLEDLAEI